MSLKPCDNCQEPIDFVKEGGRWRPAHPRTKEDHRLTCKSEKARAWRIRRGHEQGWFATSPSAIATYLKCPTRYGDLYPMANGQVRIPDVELPEGVLGLLIHEHAAARQAGRQPPTGIIPLEYVREYEDIRLLFDRQFDAGLWPGADAAVEDSQLYEWEDESGLRVQMRVIVDRWTYEGGGRVLATDWKTGWAIPREDDLWRDVQAICTAVILRRNPDLGGTIKQVGFQHWLGRHGRTVGPIWFSAELLDSYEEALHRLVHQIITDEELAPNPYCTVCPVGRHEVVNAYPIAVGEGGQTVITHPHTPEQAEEIAHIAWAAKRVEKAAMDALRPYTEQHGPVMGIGHRQSVSYEIADAEEARKILLELDYKDLDRWFEMPGRKVKSIMTAKTYAGLRELMEKRGCIRKVVNTRYEAKSPKAEGLVIDAVAVPDEPAPELPPGRPTLRVVEDEGETG